MDLFAKCKNEVLDEVREKGIYPYFHPGGADRAVKNNRAEDACVLCFAHR